MASFSLVVAAAALLLSLASFVMGIRSECEISHLVRDPEVLRAGSRGPVAIREGKTGAVLVLMPQQLVEAHNEVQRLAALFVRVVVESQRADPSSAHLDEAGFIAEWSASERTRFVRGFGEALAASLAADDPAPAQAFVSLMSHANDVVPAPLDGVFSEPVSEALAARFSRSAR
jgi:hypothetical protein